MTNDIASELFVIINPHILKLTFSNVNRHLDTVHEIIAIDPISKQLSHMGQMWQGHPISKIVH